MRKLRLWIILVGIWLIFLFNIERVLFGLDANILPLNTYIFVALIIVTVLAIPKLHGRSFVILLSLAVGAFLVYWYNYPVWRVTRSYEVSQVTAITLLTIIQISSIILSGLLARQVNLALCEFEAVIAGITFSHVGSRPKPFSEEQGGMYKELKRSRFYQRPLSVIALQVQPETIQTAIPKMVEQVQQALMKEFVLAGIARVLDKQLHGFNLIALRDNCFIIALPEVIAADAPELGQKLGRVIETELGISLQIGVANYPDHAETFESLVEKAVEAAAYLPKIEGQPENLEGVAYGATSNQQSQQTARQLEVYN